MSNQITVADVVTFFDQLAPRALQENYDNSGWQVGDPSSVVSSVLLTLDVTEEVVDEAINSGCQLILAHHPLIFQGLKKITGSTETERCILKSVRNHISIVALHTNLDNIRNGVNGKIAEKIGLQNCRILQPLKGNLRKLVTFVPTDHLEPVREAIFAAGAGHIGNYDQCSYSISGKGTFRGNDEANPFVGTTGKLHEEPEVRIETIFPAWIEGKVIEALLKAHPYEEVAYDVYALENAHPQTGAGMVGELPEGVEETDFLDLLKRKFNIPIIRHSRLRGKPVKKVALCGGAGSFLLKEAMASGADIFITGDIKYHQFFEPSGKIILADIGHYESEQFTKELFYELLTKNFPTFAVRFSGVITNPVMYYR